MNRISSSAVLLVAALIVAGCGGDGGTDTGGPTVGAIRVDPGTTVVPVGKTTQLTGIALNENEEVLIGVSGFQFSSSNPAVAQVNGSTGVVTGFSTGTASITVSLNRPNVSPVQASVTVTDISTQPMVTAASGANTFTPDSLRVTVGTWVVFNFLSRTHNVTFADIAGAPTDIPARSNTTVARNFGAAGTFNYECTIHPGMTGKIVVEP